MSKDFLAKKKEINMLQTDVNALKAVDERIWTNLDTINKTASTAKIKAEEGVAKADDALTATRTNATNINTLQTDVKALDATDERIWTNLDTINKTASTAKIKAEEGVAKANDALTATRTNADNITNLQTDVTDLINEKNIMGSRLTTAENTLNNVKTTAETAETKADDALTKASSNTTNINTLQTDVNALKAVDERIWTNLDTINKTASTAKTKAEEGVAKADDALTATRTNATNISTHETRLDSIDNTLSSYDTRITTAQQKANSVDEKVNATNEVVGQLSTSLQSAYNKINAHANDIAINRTTLGTQCKNLFKVTIASQTAYGVTFAVNADKSITVNGTATQNIYLNMGSFYFEADKQYILNGCPSGGSETKYFLAYDGMPGHQYDTGSGTTFSVSESVTKPILLVIKSGQTVSNLTFKPMLRYADITDSTFEPYKESVDERLIEDKSNIAINKTTLGYQRKNLLKPTNSITRAGITYTVNQDGSVTLTGASTTGSTYNYFSIPVTLKPGKYKVNGMPSTSSNSTYRVDLRSTESGGTVYGYGAKEFEVEFTETTTAYYMIRIDSSYKEELNGITFYPMIRYADISDDTYKPYKESVDERLIKNKSDIAVNKSTIGTQCKNLHDTLSVNWYQPDKISVASNGTVTATITSDTRNFTYANSEHYITLEAGNYIITANTLKFVAGSSALIRGCNSDNQSLFALSVSSAGLHKTAFSLSKKTTIGIMYKLYSQTCTIMIRDADILGDTYEPYSDNVDMRLIENKSNTAINKSTLGYHCKNLLNETEYLSSIASVSIGTFNISGNSITLSATGKDCYTKPHTSSDGGYRIPVEPDTDYILSWESDNTYDGLVYAFMNGNSSQQRLANNKDTKYLKFTTKSNTTFITIRFGVATSGNSITYSNIMLRYADITDNTYEPYQPSLQEQTPYSISVPGKSTSAAISYNGVPTLICLTPNTADSTTGGLYMINSAGAVIKLMAETGIVIATNTANNTFTITNNTTTVMDVCISRCWGR